MKFWMLFLEETVRINGTEYLMKGSGSRLRGEGSAIKKGEEASVCYSKKERFADGN